MTSAAMDATLTARALGPAADGEVWARLRTHAASIPQVEGVRAHATALRAEPISELPPSVYLEYERTGDRAHHGDLYFQRRRRLAALALSALLDPAEDVGELAATIEAICTEPQWALPAHLAGAATVPPGLVVDLFAAETGSALAEITTLLAGRLPEAVVASAREHVRRRVLDSYASHTFWWEDAASNWAAVCAGSVALAALQLCEEDRVRAMAPRLRASLRRSLDGYGDDGVCVEGFGYWNYGFGYYLLATEALDAAIGPDPEGEAPRAAAAARWPSRAFLTGGVVVPFADTHPTDTVSVGLVAATARRYGQVGRPDPGVADTALIDECGRWALALHGLCRLPAALADDPFADTPERPLWYPDAQWLVIPQGSRSPIGFAARAGDNAEPHNHNDLGSFAIALDGEPLLGDAGRGIYDREYFGPQRYDNPAAGSHGHPVPLLDGVRQQDGARARAEVLAAESDGEGERLVVDLTSAYPHPALTRLVRTVARAGASVTVRDEVLAQAPVRLTQRHICQVRPQVAGPGRVLVQGERGAAELVHDPTLLVEVGAFDVGRGSFEHPVFYVDLSVAEPRVEADLVTTVHVSRV
ncbi:heparinase II/III family protein [Occultella aeris]|uniref:Heparinase II/III-like protein n=1 Tax=Occultella aeris TaxID=2761496 RepID=A0A7M4DGD9_9MICO|nr:heparinase II/III family protein [Occultella aeris]VZO35982.1 Heparinase II/III-like protein [Occultella aeris]